MSVFTGQCREWGLKLISFLVYGVFLFDVYHCKNNNRVLTYGWFKGLRTRGGCAEFTSVPFCPLPSTEFIHEQMDVATMLEAKAQTFASSFDFEWRREGRGREWERITISSPPHQTLRRLGIFPHTVSVFSGASVSHFHVVIFITSTPTPSTAFHVS